MSENKLYNLISAKHKIIGGYNQAITGGTNNLIYNNTSKKDVFVFIGAILETGIAGFVGREGILSPNPIDPAIPLGGNSLPHQFAHVTSILAAPPTRFGTLTPFECILEPGQALYLYVGVNTTFYIKIKPID